MRRPIRSAPRTSAPIISAAKAAKPDAFVAFSYPLDTFALTDQAQIQKLDVGAFYVGVGTAFPGYAARFKDNANGVMGVGGITPNSKAIQDYRKRHKEVTGADADSWASATTYAGLEILGQAIERAGTRTRPRSSPRSRRPVQDGDRRGQSRRQRQPQGLDRRSVAGRLVQRRRLRGIAGAKAPVKKEAWK